MEIIDSLSIEAFLSRMTIRKLRAWQKLPAIGVMKMMPRRFIPQMSLKFGEKNLKMTERVCFFLRYIFRTRKPGVG